MIPSASEIGDEKFYMAEWIRTEPWGEIYCELEVHGRDTLRWWNWNYSEEVIPPNLGYKVGHYLTGGFYQYTLKSLRRVLRKQLDMPRKVKLIRVNEDDTSSDKTN